MMTFYVLENFPEKLHNKLKEIWNQGNWVNTLDADPGVMTHYHLSVKHEIFDELPYAKSVEYYANTPRSTAAPHLDRGRWCAINVPIDVDTKNSCFMTGKYFHLNKYKRKTHLDNSYAFKTVEDGPSGFYYEDKDLFDYYNLEKPVIFCTKVPHGFHNDCDTERVLCSITFDKKWEEVLHLIPQDWY